MTLKSSGWSAALVAGLLLLATLMVSPKAQACRDCPFPMKIGDHRWLMPDSDLVIVIESEDWSDKTVYTSVYLVDQRSGQTIASGGLEHLKNQRSVSLTLLDASGHRVSGSITWVDPKASVIQARFDCADSGACMIAKEMRNFGRMAPALSDRFSERFSR